MIVVGLDTTQEAEGLDRYSIALPGVQSQLIAAVAAAAKGPVIVVVMSGGAVDLSQVVANSKVDAILWIGYPGQSGGQALAEIVFGDAVPSGRTIYTFYDSSFVQQSNFYDMGMRPVAGSNPGRTYRFYTGTPVFPFGWGT